MADISDELVERMVALVRHMAAVVGDTPINLCGGDYVDALCIARALPAPVDPDLIEAREMVAAGHDIYAAESPWHANEADRARAGDSDRFFRVSDTFAGIRRGRELERAALAKAGS